MLNLKQNNNITFIISILALTLSLSFLFTFNLAAASFSGELNTSAIYEQDADRWQDQSYLELDYQHDLSFDLNYYLKGALTLESFYQQ
jgi:hypothetical protein